MVYDPVKIIFKYKNNKRIYQYSIYIYVGLIENTLDKILQKIKNINFIDTIKELNNNEIELLIKNYGINWHTKFFNTYHIDKCYGLIREDVKLRNIVMNKLGRNWIDKFIETDNLFDTNTKYEYGHIIKIKYKNKMKNIIDDDNNVIINVKDSSLVMRGGNDGKQDLDDFIDENYDNIDDELKQIENIQYDKIKEKDVYNNQQKIKKILFDDEKRGINNFDESKNDNFDSIKLKDVYKKIYINTQYIYRDDTIKKIKEKICCSINNSNKFENKIINPSRQYLWSEYVVDKQIKKIMLEFKWIHKNNLMNIDVEPHDLHYYETINKDTEYLRNIEKKIIMYKRENNEHYLLNDYEKYMMNNEIFMIDIYNEIGLNYRKDKQIVSNVYSIYVSLYYPKISEQEYGFIIEYLNNISKEREIEKSRKEFTIINNELLIENEIMNTVEYYKRNAKYDNIYTVKYIMQTIINVEIIETKDEIDLYHIFNNFKLDDAYIFIQYKIKNGINVVKFKNDTILNLSNIDRSKKKTLKLLSGINGITIKLYLKKYKKIITIYLNEEKRLEYRITWNEEDGANYDNVNDTYNEIQKLIKKINEENRFLFELGIPLYEEFNYTYISISQKFALPADNPIFDHNKFQELIYIFYPYIVLVNYSKKKSEKHKYGTFLRYKRKTNYDDTINIIKRIIYIMKNYEYNREILIKEICNQFNISEEKAIIEIDKVNTVFKDKIKKRRKIYKKIEEMPKQKLPGIGIFIQGKEVDRYKVHIIGAKSVDQVSRIFNFINIMLYLYIEININKNKKIIDKKNKLEQILNIATKINKVDTIIQHQDESKIKTLKTMTKMDKNRIGYKGDSNVLQWSRACQNNGKKIRRPQVYNESMINKLVKDGYLYNKKTKLFEKKYKNYILKALMVDEYDETNKKTGKMLYYVCNPQINGEYMFIGFLTKSKNPNDIIMPCCFKKNQELSKNKQIKKLFFRHLYNTDIKTSDVQDKKDNNIYILNDTNKLSEGKYSLLSPLLDYYLNDLTSRTKKISANILIESKNGYYFKCGVQNNSFFGMMCSFFDVSINKIISKIQNISHNVFLSLNGGEIYTIFKNIDNYINFVKSEITPNHIYLYDLCELPNIFTDKRLHILIFEKKNNHKKKSSDITLLYNNIDDPYKCQRIDDNYIMIVKEDNLYFPIVNITKNNNNIQMAKIMKYNDSSDNIISYINNYYKEIIHNFLNPNIITSKQIEYLLLKKTNHNILFQCIDYKNKCIFIITNKAIIPLNPSVILYSVPIIEYQQIFKYTRSLKATIDGINELNKLLSNMFTINGYYCKNNKQRNIIVGIKINNFFYIPISETKIDNDNIQTIEPFPTFYFHETLKSNNNYIYDNENLNLSLFFDQEYKNFKFHFSYFVNKNVTFKNILISIIIDEETPIKRKKKMLSILLYKFINPEIYKDFIKIKNIDKNDEVALNMSHICEISNIDDIRYKKKEILYLCDNYNKNECEKCPDCKWIQNKCMLTYPKIILILFSNKLITELINYDYKTKEILNIDEYKMSNIINRNIFSDAHNENIYFIDDITSYNNILDFIIKKENMMEDQIEIKNMTEFNNYFIQDIINNNILYRAFSNGYYFSTFSYLNMDNKNLGYNSLKQTSISNYVRGIFIEWTINFIDKKIITELLNRYKYGLSLREFILSVTRPVSSTSLIVEMHILSKIFGKQIIVYNNNFKPIYFFNKDIIYTIFDKNKNDMPKKFIYNDSIMLQFIFNKIDDVYPKPINIKVIYIKDADNFADF